MNSISNLLKDKKTRNWAIAIAAVVIVILAGAKFSSANADTTAEVTEAKVEVLEVGETIEASG